MIFLLRRVQGKREKGLGEDQGPGMERPHAVVIRVKRHAPVEVFAQGLKGDRCPFRGDFPNADLRMSLRDITPLSTSGI